MITRNRKLACTLLLAFGGLTLGGATQAQSVESFGELCFRLREPGSRETAKLLRIEIVLSGTRHLSLKGVFKDLTGDKPYRYWIMGTSHALTGEFDVGIDAWYAGQVGGVRDIADSDPGQVHQMQATFTHPLPFDTAASRWQDSLANGQYEMALAHCTDADFKALLRRDAGGGAGAGGQ